MVQRSNRRIFRRRRRRAGFALLVSLAAVVFGAAMFSSLNPLSLNLSAASGGKVTAQKAGSTSAQAQKAGKGSGAAQAAANDGAKAGKDKKLAPAEKKAQKPVAKKSQPRQQPKKQQQASSPPAIPKPATNDLWMDIPALGISGAYVTNDGSEAALDQGATKLTSSGFPWQPYANTYIVGHRLGWPGTASYHLFYDLPLLGLGAKIYLYDDNGTVYTYSVTSFHEVLPSETWITAPKPGRNMISLQTCIENYGDYWTMGPNWYVRYVVQADRVSVTPG